MRNSEEMKKQGALCGLSLAQRGIKPLLCCSLSVVSDRPLGRREQCGLKVLPPNLASPLLFSPFLLTILSLIHSEQSLWSSDRPQRQNFGDGWTDTTKRPEDMGRSCGPPAILQA